MKSLFSQLKLNNSANQSKVVRELLTPEQIDVVSGAMNKTCSYTQSTSGSSYDQKCEVE